MTTESGLIILDKPSGVGSREIVEVVKNLLERTAGEQNSCSSGKSVRAVKILAGHVGTLDPNATGVLPILFGRATRIAVALEHADKEYVATVHLHKDIDDDTLSNALMKFIGKIKQKPPVHSAVARKNRERTVYSIGVLSRDGKNLKLHIMCEAGTYVRKIASDLGIIIGGAHLAELRRIRAGPFTENEAHTFEELKKAVGDARNGDNSSLSRIILSVERAVEHLPKVEIDDSGIKDVLNGTPLRNVSLDAEDGTLVAIMLQGKLIALGRKNGSNIKIGRVIAKSAEREIASKTKTSSSSQ